MSKLIWLILVSMVLTIGCAKNDGGGGSDASGAATMAPSPSPSPSPGTLQIPTCSDLPKCTQQCSSIYPYRNPQDIANEYNSRGLLNSGLYTAAVQANNQLIAGYGSCLTLPANQVVNYP